MTRCECGLSYVEGLAEDEKVHVRIHDEYVNGATLQALPSMQPAGHVAGFPVVVADGTTPKAIRKELATAALVAQRTMPDYPAGYDGTVTDGDERLFLVASKNRAVAMALTSLDDYYWLLKWKRNSSLELMSKEAVLGERQKIGRVWVAKAYRGKGIATELLRLVADMFGRPLGELGWELPLTADGRRLLRRLVPETWLGRGDAFALSETLEAPLEGTIAQSDPG